MTSPRAGQPAAPEDLIDVSALVAAYYDLHPDPAIPEQRVSFGTSGHRGSSLTTTFNEDHIIATSQAICEYRAGQGIIGPLFLGGDTHALSEPATTSALEVFAANDVTVLTEPLALLLMLGMLIAVERRSWVIGGALTGLLLLTRPSAQLLLPVVALFIWWKADWRKAAVFLVAGIICVVPWVIRNEIYFGSPVIVTSNGFNLAAIWSSQAIAQERFIDPVKDPRLASVRHYRTASGAIDYSNFNEAHLDAAFRRAGIQGLEHHLGRAPRILLDNVEFLTDYNWRWDDSAERLDGRNMGVRHATLPFVWATEILGAIGLVLLARRGQVLVPLVALYFFAVALVTVSPPRLRAPYDVLTCVAVGYLATVVWKHFEARRGLSGSKEMHSDA